jgi:gamma-glutamylcyclotransferase (GGCT)/AIG2-like uncharacterized protein YtfP
MQEKTSGNRGSTMTETRYYFAYGSNLCEEDWNEHFPSGPAHAEALKAVGPARLPDFELAFTIMSEHRAGGVLNLQGRVGSVVHGMLYEVAAEGWKALDEKEGAPHVYKRAALTVLDRSGNEVAVVTYADLGRPRPFVPPSTRYLKVVSRGLQRYGLPNDGLLYAARGEQSSAGTTQVFVCGTLMRGEVRHGVVREHQVKSMLLAETPGRLLDLGEFPALVPAEKPKARVLGELVTCRDGEGLLQRLDAVEGFRGFGRADNLFRRTIFSIGMMDGHEREAWTYVYARPAEHARPIPSGDWREHRGVRSQFLERLVGGHCAADELSLARALLRTYPIPPEDEDEALREILPLAKALERGALSERELSFASGKCTVEVDLIPSP